MAGVSTAISVQDRVSGALNRITASLYDATSAFDAVDRASETSFNAAGVQAMTRELYAYEEHIQQIESELVRTTRRLDEMEDETRQNKSAANDLQSAFSSIAGVVASLGIGMLVKQQVTEAINYASDLTEVQNVVDTVFGDNSAIDEWSKTTLEAFGINELSAKQFAGTMGAMLSSSGMTGKNVEQMSQSMTALAGDMASFYNLDPEEAFNKIRAGISGETEPLKQLGINMSVANLEAYALSQGIKTSYDKMDQASQTMLRYNYLLQATSNAQGDFAKTSDSYANQTKLLKENWSAFTGELATNALPLLAYGVGLLNSAVSFISENWSVVAPILGGLITMIGAYTTALIVHNIIKVVSAVLEYAHAKAVLADTAAYTAKEVATAKATVAQAGFNATLLACPITWIIAAIIALIAIIIAVANYIAKTSDVAGSAFGVICGWVMVAGATFKNLGLTVANIALGIGNVLAALGSNIVIAFKNSISSVQSFFYDLLSTVLTVVGKIAEGLNKLPFVEFDYSGITDKAQQYADKAAAENKKSEYKSVGGAFKKGMGTFDTFEKGWAKDAFAKGASWGDGVSDKVKKKLDGLNKAGTSGIDTSGAYSPVDTDNIKGIKDDTSNISKSVDVSNENLKYLRDIAEKDAINRFTTAEIKVDMKNNNTINNGMDIDGVINQLSAGLNEAMSVAAEGVH